MISLHTSFVALPTLVGLTALSDVAHAQPVMPPTHSSVVAESYTAELPTTVRFCSNTPRYFAVPEVFKENIEHGVAIQAIDDAVAGTSLPIYSSGGANVVSHLMVEDVTVKCKRRKPDGTVKRVHVAAERERFVAIAGFDYYCSTVELCPPLPDAPVLGGPLVSADGGEVLDAAAAPGIFFFGPDPAPPANDLSGWLETLATQAPSEPPANSYWDDGMGFDTTGMSSGGDNTTVAVSTGWAYGEVSEHCQRHPMLVECGGTGTVNPGIPQTRHETSAAAMWQGWEVCQANTGWAGCSGNITQWSYWQHDGAYGVDERVIAQRTQMIYYGDQSYL